MKKQLIWTKIYNTKLVKFSKEYSNFYLIPQMLQNEHKMHIKTKDKSQSVQIFQSEFCDQPLPSKYIKKYYKRSNEIPNTQPVTRNKSLQSQQKNSHVKSGFNIHRKYFIKGRDASGQKDDPSFGRSIFSRRVNSETKASKSKIQHENSHIQKEKSESKINFAKKLIEDLKKQTFKMRKSSSRYSASKSASKSVQLSQEKLMNRDKLIKNSMQKLRPEFNINEVKFFSSKQSLSKISNEPKAQSSSSLFKSNKVKSVNLQEKISKEISKFTKQSQQTLNKTLKKISCPLTSYGDYIKSSKQTQYEIKLGFLNQYITLAQKQGVLAHIDFSSIKLLQSIYLCLVDIFSVLLNQNSNKSHMGKNFNYQIVKEYAEVYFQTYSKLKSQFILCEILFKSVKKKLIQYFLMQRLIFYCVVQLCSEQKISEHLNDVKKVVTFIKLSEEILSSIVNMLFEDSLNKKAPKDSFIDTFKSLRLTRELDKRLPLLRDCIELMSFPQKQKNNQSFTQISQCLLQLLSNTDKQQHFDILTLFKLQQYFNWTTLSIPPLFYLPSSPSKPYTLIIDLDQTLIYYNQQTRILKYRPYMDRFLQAMQKHFELVVFSSYPKERSDIIVNEIERGDNVFAYRLYKSHMVFQQGVLRKNVGYLGRNLQKIVFVDDEEKNTEWLASSSFKIKPFTGDKQDKELLNLSDWLTGMISTQPTDLRGKIKKPQTSLDEIVEIDQSSSTIQPSIEYMEGKEVFVHRKQN